MTVEMIDRETVRTMTEKFLSEGNEINKKSSCYTGYEVFKVCEDWRTLSVRESPRNWTEDHFSSNFWKKHPFEVYSDKEYRLELEIKYLNFDMVNERIDLFKHENPDWKENHMEVIWELESERDSHLI